jgi:hypothetical protein
MDIGKFIDENLDDILENTDEYISNILPKMEAASKKKISWQEEIEANSKIVDNSNEEEYSHEEMQDELFEQMYTKKLLKKNNKQTNTNTNTNIEAEAESDSEDNQDEEEKTEEFLTNMLNIFMIHFNDKYEKKLNFFTGIKDETKDTTNQMELFFEAIIEFKMFKQRIELEKKDEEIEDIDCLNYYFKEENKEKIKNLMNSANQVYCLEYKNEKIYTECLIICLNYILINKKDDDIYIKDWHIYNLKDN